MLTETDPRAQSAPVALPQPGDGRLDGRVHHMALRVYYEDTDLSGVVYHANYLRWFERARSDLLRLLGIDQRAAIDAGQGSYAVAGMIIRYTAPARLGDVVSIESVVQDARAASCRMRQRASRGLTLLCEADVRIAFVGPDLRPRRQPQAWRAAFAQLLASAPAHLDRPEE